CIAFGGRSADEAIEGELLRVLEPAAIEAALEAQREETRRCDEVLEALRRDLEAARYAADKAFRQYDATDPANRLVAGELELRWNRSLERVSELENRIERHVGKTSVTAPSSPEQFAMLATDLKTIWGDPSTDSRLKKRIVRELIREVIADIDAQCGEIILRSLGGRYSYRIAHTAPPARTAAQHCCTANLSVGTVVGAHLQRRRDRGPAQSQ